jgi:hypothetical protein
VGAHGDQIGLELVDALEGQLPEGLDGVGVEGNAPFPAQPTDLGTETKAVSGRSASATASAQTRP